MILAIDPSGNFNEGKGISGWVLMEETNGKIIKFGAIDASTSIDMEEHWDKHIDLIMNMDKEYEDIVVVIEDYMLQASKAMSQTNSRMETPKLIGVVQYFCWIKDIKLVMQTPVSVKRRWKDFLLSKKGYMEMETRTSRAGISYAYCSINGFRVNGHVIDALRHAVHYYTFQSKKEDDYELQDTYE